MYEKVFCNITFCFHGGNLLEENQEFKALNLQHHEFLFKAGPLAQVSINTEPVKVSVCRYRDTRQREDEYSNSLSLETLSFKILQKLTKPV